MIDDSVWIEGIAGTARLIAAGTIEDVWANKVEGVTSVVDFSELYEQVFDDLDSENLIVQFAGDELKQAAKQFIDALQALDEIVMKKNITDERAILKLAAWQDLQRKAFDLSTIYFGTAGKL